MTQELISAPGARRARSASRWLTGLVRRSLFARLRKLAGGHLLLEENGSRHAFGDPDAPAELRARVEVLDPGCYLQIALGGSIGVAEAYMHGDLRCDDPTALVRIFARNQDVLDALEKGPQQLTMPLLRVAHFLNRNSLRGSRRNIAAHYDLGNDFFALFLDRSLMYSAAIYPHQDASLDEAARYKLDAVCRKLELEPGQRLLEIGTGWGGMALHAAGEYGCHVTTTTISRRQHELARQRVREAGLQDRVEVLLSDYRELDGHYDRLVSIEMFEAVGHRYFDTFFRQCNRLLEPAGRMLLQTITIADQRYEQARRSVDFIQRYIFPGGCLPSVAAIADSVARVTALRIVDLQDIGPHYARTLADWRARFTRRLDAVRGQGYPDSFIRMWEWYLCYCEGGFAERAIGNVQLLLSGPRDRLPLAPLAGREGRL